MKKILSLLLFCSIVFCASAQHKYGQRIIKNQNTDPEFSQIKRAFVQVSSKVAGTAKSAEVVSFVDNSATKYFPKVINQVGGSCAYASGVGYIYNYEFNQKFELDASKSENVLNYLYVYAMCNDGDDVGGNSYQAWDMISSNGVPNLADSSIGGIKSWCSGYDAYYNGMNKGVIDYARLNSGSQAGINEMKQYLLDHGDGSSHGGLIQFSAWAHPLDCDEYDGPRSVGGYAHILPRFGCDGMHSMTICGYDDKVEFDFGGTAGVQTGAFICVNSWGEWWSGSSKGRFYVPYYTFSTLKQSPYDKSGNNIYDGEGGTGNGGKACLVVKVDKAEANLTLRIKMEHSSRNDIAFEVGIANTKGAIRAEKTIACKFMKHKGGDNNMTAGYGSEANKLEFGINISELQQYITDSENVTYFIKLIQAPLGTVGKGVLVECALYDYTLDKENPIVFPAKFSGNDITGTISLKGSVDTSVPDLDFGKSFNAYCNLSGKKLLLTLSNDEECLVKMDILTTSGNVIKSIMSEDIAKGLTRRTLSLKSLVRGTYVIRIISGNTYIYQKLILE